MEISIKDRNSSGLISLRITSREASEKWLVAECNFELHGFISRFQFSLMQQDLVRFYSELKTLNETLQGHAHLTTIEDNVRLAFAISELGQIEVNGILRDGSYSVKTTFVLELDQSYLPEILTDCRQGLSELQISFP